MIKEIKVKSVLTKSGIPGADYCINPYVGCFHACRYCYATFMKKYTGHTEEWGSFIDVKINAPDVLRRQLKRSKRGSIILSSVTDGYQPVEERYRLTRQCLEILLEYQFPVDILTKSPLVLRDMDIIEKFREIDVGLTVTTNDEEIRKIFEPKAPPINARIEALRRLHEKGIRTYVFIGPVLPMSPEALAEKLRDHIDSLFIDKMHYTSKTFRIFRHLRLEKWLDPAFTADIINRLRNAFKGKIAYICSM